MPVALRAHLKLLFALAAIFCSSACAYGSHIFGIDLYYSHVGLNTYKVHLIVYGDCSSAVFFTLATASPTIDVYNGDTYLSSITLAVQPPSTGVEVTPVCPAQAGNTTCSDISNPLPGIKKFVYEGNVTLTGTSSVFRFLFSGVMGGTTTGGRSSSITNISSPGTSVIQLVDTLNNIGSSNSSSVYTTIPTPFFCINTAANYNPGAVDPETDSLSFALVPAIDASTASSVSYISPYTATAPLGVTSGLFSFNSSTGQLSFTPNIVQKALVVYNVEEYRSGVLKGTSQREMTVVVLSPCSNEPPMGSVSTLSAGAIIDSTDVSVCSNTDSFNFHINPTDPNGDSITMTATGLPAGATFTILNNGTTAPLGTFGWSTISKPPGTYTFYITYQDNGCPLIAQQTIAYSITILPPPTVTYALLSAATCSRKAAFTITPGGTGSPWLIKVLLDTVTLHSFPGTTTTITDSLFGGTYTIRVYNASNCYADTTFTIASPPLPSAIITTALPLCPGTITGSITVSGSGTLAPYQYAIGTGAFSSSGTFTGLASGTYVIHISDANGCVKDTTVNVSNPSPTLEHIFIRKPLCDTQANGRVIIQAYNSVAPYTYSTGSGTFTTNDTFTSLAAGTYTFHIKNGNGCITDTTITLADSLHLSGAVSIVPIACYGDSAAITVTGISGSGSPYTYAYNTGTFGPLNLFTLPAGSYTFHIHDAQSCAFDTALTITQPTPVSFTASVTNVSCYGTATGSAVITATGGSPSYTYAADAGSYTTFSTIAALIAGAHILHVKDANGCVFSDSITVTQPLPVTADSISTHMPLCHSGSDGTITIHASGGIPGYSYACNTGAYSISNTFTGLSAGSYILHIKDANGCIKDTIVSLSEPTAITPSAIVRPSFCNTLANGRVMLSATGGTPGYTYAIGSGTYTSASLFTPLAAGTYSFHIKDANGCIKDTSITITDSLIVSGTFAITAPSCYDLSDGVIMAAGTGGISPYTYAIGTSAYTTADSFSSLHAGTYAIRIKDINGCIDSSSVTVTQPANILPAVAITQPACYGYSNGSVIISASGGTAGYTFSFDGGAFATTTAYTGLPAGADSFTVKDAHGCLHDTAFTILQPSPLVISSISITDVSCNGGANGTVTIAGAGGTGPYQYAANSSPYQSGTMLTGLPAGTQIIHIQDSHGCIKDTTITIAQPAPLLFSGADTVNPTCEGYKNGSVHLSAAGGTAPYSFSIDNVTFSSSTQFNDLAEGTYTFYMTDAHGCVADTTITLTGYPHIIISSLDIKEPSCAGYNDGSVTVTATGGLPPFSYSITGSSTHSAPNTFSSMFSGNYTITVTDSKNCIKDTTFRLPEPDTMTLATTVTPNNCIGLDVNGSVVITVTGGTSPYRYVWNIDTLNSAGIYHLPNGTYSALVKDANNCEDSIIATIGYNDCCTPYLPNAFSPNNDGNNDHFKLLYKGDVHIIQFSVFDRFGERVFVLENQDGAWDGTFNGVPCELGTYYYYLKFTCGNLQDKVQVMKGDVTLVR